MRFAIELISLQQFVELSGKKAAYILMVLPQYMIPPLILTHIRLYAYALYTCITPITT